MGRFHLIYAIASLIGLGLNTTGCNCSNPAQASSSESNNRTEEPEAERFPDLPTDHYISTEALQSMLYFSNNIRQHEERGGFLSSNIVALLPPSEYPIRINQVCLLPGQEQTQNISAESVGYLRGQTCQPFQDSNREQAFSNQLSETLEFFSNIDPQAISSLHYFNGLYAYTATRPYAENMRNTLQQSLNNIRYRTFNSRREAALWMFEENARIIALDDPNLYNLSMARCGYSSVDEDRVISSRMRDIVLRAVEVQSQEPVGTLVFSMALMLPARRAIDNEISQIDPANIRGSGNEIEIQVNGSWQTSSEFYVSTIQNIPALQQLQEFQGFIRANLALSMGANIIDQNFNGDIYTEIQQGTIGNNEIQSDWCAEVDRASGDNKLSELIPILTDHHQESYQQGRRPLAAITLELRDISRDDGIYGFLQAHTLITAANLFLKTEEYVRERLELRRAEE